MMAQPNYTDKQPSPALSVNLSSNNPFRNRAGSPGFASPSSAEFNQAPPRPTSRNPFLDSESSNKMATNSGLTGNTADLFNNLSLDDKSGSNYGSRPSASRSKTYDRSENVPPHRPSRSQEEALRARKPGASVSSSRRAPADELDIFADPSDSPRKERRPRRNSDSSAMERPSRRDEDEERRRQERRRRERRHREREGKDKDGKTSSNGKKPDRKLDVIDKLDVTSIYGTGLFHHDGPFDACNPHRNRQGSRRAPMQAFPKDSLNNVLGGSGPLNKRPDHATFMGNNDDEAFKDYSTGASNADRYGNGAISSSRNPQGEVIDSRVQEAVHGEESAGLGTSTFLDGAPAPRSAMQRRETDDSMNGNGGLQRKKSLAQKIRGISNNRRDYGGSGRMMNDEALTSPGSPYTPGGSKRSEPKGYFDEFGMPTTMADAKKGESITIVEPLDKPGRARAASNPRDDVPSLNRRRTNEGPPTSYVEPKQSGGFLSRVKSLKGGPRKPREPKPLV